MKKTLGEWIEWADNQPTTSTDTLIKYVGWCKSHEQLHALRTGLPVNYDQKITFTHEKDLLKPRTRGSNK